MGVIMDMEVMEVYIMDGHMDMEMDMDMDLDMEKDPQILLELSVLPIERLSLIQMLIPTMVTTGKIQLFLTELRESPEIDIMDIHVIHFIIEKDLPILPSLRP